MVINNYGWSGRVIRVDLSSSEIVIENSTPYTNIYVGGKGLGQNVLIQELDRNISALDSDNIMAFSAGPLTGTNYPASCRLSIDSKNYVTGGVGSANVGGHFGPQLKFAGFDSVIIKGKSLAPVVLIIINDQVVLINADNLWGLTTRQTERFIKTTILKDLSVLSIGPAGENLVKSAAVICDGGRAAARCGLGAIMGSKKLKAIAVYGSNGVKVANPLRFFESVKRAKEMIEKGDAVKRFRVTGTPSGIWKTNQMCRLPYRNHQDDHWAEEKLERILPSSIKALYEKRKVSCFNCPIMCSAFYRITHGEFKGVSCEGFAANLMWDYMSKFDMDNVQAALRIQEICIDYGLDIDNSSGVLAWAFELYEKGILKMSDTDDLELLWGNYKAIITLLKKLAYREGIGALLALGVKEASAIVGQDSAYYAMHIKDQELAEGIRTLKGWSLGTVLSPRGGGHLDGAITTEIRGISSTISEKMFGVKTAGDPSTYSGKPEIIIWFERFKGIVDMLGICCFGTQWLQPEHPGVSELTSSFNAATGSKYEPEELMGVGERLINLQKAFNTIHAGFTRENDYAPERFYKESVASGPMAGAILDKEEWDIALNRYYKIHNWDEATGLQTKSGLISIGLREIMHELENYKLI